MRKILRPLLIRTHRAIKLGGLDSEATVSFTRCFKDSKTKCDKAGKEISKKPAGGKNKESVPLTKVVVPPLGF